MTPKSGYTPLPENLHEPANPPPLPPEHPPPWKAAVLPCDEYGVRPIVSSEQIRTSPGVCVSKQARIRRGNLHAVIWWDRDEIAVWIASRLSNGVMHIIADGAEDTFDEAYRSADKALTRLAREETTA